MLSAVRSSLIRGVRYSHSSAVNSTIPSPRGQTQDVASFLKAIGRGCEEFAGKYESWDHLFTTGSRVMKTDMGINTKQRKYILSWLQRYRNGVEPYAIATPGLKKK
ncbi:IGR protein motif-domain-containing protein [Parasitella parasitica]|nr:IGR protein motif-domain-containing protein [Parasitella parasitica]